MTRGGRVRSAAAVVAVHLLMCGVLAWSQPAAARGAAAPQPVKETRVLWESPWGSAKDTLTGPISDPSTPGYALATAENHGRYVELFRAFYWARLADAPEELYEATESAILAAWHAPCGYREFQRVEVTAGAVVEVVLSEYHRRPCADLQSPVTQLLVVAVPKGEMPEGEVVVRLRSDMELIGQIRGVLRPAGWEPPVDDQPLPVGLLVAGGLLTLVLVGGVVAVVRRDRINR